MLLFVTFALARPKDCVSEEEVAALRAKIAALEAELAARATPEEKCTATATPTASPAEDVTAVVTQVQQAVNEGKIEEAKQILAGLDAATVASSTTLTRYRNELAVIGMPAAPIVVDHWYQGLGDYGDARATLLVFFEEWCPHCKVALPELQERRAELARRDIQIIAVTKLTKSSTDEKIQQLIEENDLTFPIGKETGEMTTAFAVTGIPAAALVVDGVVIWRGHPQRLDDPLLDSLLTR